MADEDLGIWGEQQALKFLKRKGFRDVETRYRCRYGEIDLIVKNREYIVFVEVKLRKNDLYGEAKEFVTLSKQNKLRTTAELWLSQNETELQPRFDVIEIYAENGTKTRHPIINHIENAF